MDKTFNINYSNSSPFLPLISGYAGIFSTICGPSIYLNSANKSISYVLISVS